MIARQATLEDWASLKECWADLKGSRHSWKIQGEEAVLRAYFTLSLTTPAFGIPVLVDEDKVVGFAVLQGCNNQSIAQDGVNVTNSPHTFIRALYVKPEAQKESWKLEEFMSQWATDRGHEFLQGNCRPDFPDRFARMYGYEVSHVVVKKTLRKGN